MIFGERLLIEHIPIILLISKYAFHSTGLPFLLPAWSRNPVYSKVLLYPRLGLPLKEKAIN